MNDIWSQISYKNDKGKKAIGYIPTSVLENVTDTKETEEETKIAEVDGQEAGVIHKSEGKGVFADAVDGVTASRDKSVEGYDESYDCCRSYTDSVWIKSCD